MPAEAVRGDVNPERKRSGLKSLRRFFKLLLEEGLDPRRAAAAVFLGVFIAVVPVYGFQSLIALGLAALFRLNKPLTFGSTFVNNPLLQPFLIIMSLALGHPILTGKAWSIPEGGITGQMLREQLTSWVVGSVILGLILGCLAAAVAFLLVRHRTRERAKRRAASRFINSHFRTSPAFPRGFVRWKIRLDRIYDLLLAEELGRGDAVDLGCGYGMTLALAAFQDPGRRLIGCDLDSGRIEVAGRALRPLHAEVKVHDVRSFEFPAPGVIMILDVLQYLEPGEQRDLLERCCASLLPGGRLIVRVHDRKRGVAARLSLALDKVIFRWGGCSGSPQVLDHEAYERVLADAGMKVRSRRFINRLPLAHILFIADKPGAGQAASVTGGNGAQAPATP